MISFSLDQLAGPLQAERAGADVRFSTVGTDTRSLEPGSLFVALRGPRYDGHDFVETARDAGAAAALVERGDAAGLPLLRVADTLAALGRLGHLWRRASGVPLVAVTGSNGKTTVKEMIASILARRGPVLATRGNLNNEIGVPLTLLRLQEEAAAVVELGASRAGEIDHLSRMAAPDVAVLINAGRAHLEGFGSVEGVARAKAEILNGLVPGGCFVFNADDPWAPLWSSLAAGRETLSFGIDNEADIRATDAEGGDPFENRFHVATPAGETEIRLPLPGRHNRMNALAAVGAALALGRRLDEIREGLAAIPRVAGRLQPVAGRDGVRLIDDTYNANPDSVLAALRILAGAPGRRYLALGELAEMGPDGEAFYGELGRAAGELGIDRLFALKEAAPAAEAFAGGRVFEDREALVAALERELERGDWVLVKGSRRARMEGVVSALAAPGEG